MATMQFMKMMGPSTIDRQNGRVHVLNGDLYYSPNCVRDVELPEHVNEDSTPFQPPHSGKPPFTGKRVRLWDLDVRKFSKPLWWRQQFGWTAFLDSSLISRCWDPLFDPLAFSGFVRSHRQPFKWEDEDKYEERLASMPFMMTSRDQEAWMKLEGLLAETFFALRAYYNFPAFPPHRPSAFGYPARHPSSRAMYKCLEKSREWYALWGALLSYSIACAETREAQSQPYESMRRCNWLELLANHSGPAKFPRDWLDTLDTSSVAWFNSMSRVGAFVILADSGGKGGDPMVPHVSWFCLHRIPVWYRWTSAEACNALYANLAPLDHQLQQISSCLTVSPSSPSPSSFVASQAPLFLPSPPSSTTPPTPHALSFSSIGSPQQNITELSPSRPANESEHAIYVGDSGDGPSVVISGPDTSLMDAFFHQRKAAIQRKIASWTPAQEASRLQRVANPPKKSAEVFLWQRTHSGSYEATRISKRERFETLREYSESQKQYDSYFNEWHICHLWAEDSGDEGDLFDDDSNDDGEAFAERYYWAQYASLDESGTLQAENNTPTLPTTEPLAPPITDNKGDDDDDAISLGSDDSYFDNNNAPLAEFLEEDAWVCPLIGNEISENTEAQSSPPNHRKAVRQDLIEGEIIHVLSRYFGYTPRIPLLDVAPVDDLVTRKKLCRSLGIPWLFVTDFQDQIFDMPSIASGLDFFIRLSSNKTLSDDEWDLKLGNRIPVSLTSRFGQLRSLKAQNGKDVYLLDLGPAQSAPWMLGLRHARDALMVCRLDGHMNEYDIAEHLLINGIPFYTLQPLNSLRPAPSIPCPSLKPMTRKEKHQFTADDYLSFRQRCHALLRHPRGRAVLMHGGECWRLAMGVVKWEEVFKGPSGRPNNKDEMIKVVNDVTGLELSDDMLSIAEEDALCGTYLCASGVPNQEVLKSWFMPPSRYETSAYNLGRWSMNAEEMFNIVANAYTGDDDKVSSSQPSNADAMEEGQLKEDCLGRQPVGRKVWRNRARNPTPILKALRRVEQEAIKLFC